MNEWTFAEAVRTSLVDGMRQNPKSLVLGQGVRHHPAMFGTTRGIHEEFGDKRIIDFPIMEEGMTGVALGLAIRGWFPVVCHIRNDFLLLAANQLINMVAKFKYMYGGSLRAPMLIRAVVGRSWGQGPQHSQSLQSIFSHFPGLTVLMPSDANAAYRYYFDAVTTGDRPLLSIEHRWLYDLTFQKRSISTDEVTPYRTLRVGSDVTIVATSFMVREAMMAASWLEMNSGVSCEVGCLEQISAIDMTPIIESVRKTGLLVVADTSWSSYGLAAEVCRLIMETDPTIIKSPVKSLGMKPAPCPTSHSLEKEFYDGAAEIVESVLSMTHAQGPKPIPEELAMIRTKFRGPF